MTNIASTSRTGQPGRQYPQTFVADILGRVQVAVMIRAAGLIRFHAKIKHCFQPPHGRGIR